MWTIACSYFGTDNAGNEKARLLKCGQTYPVGRKDANVTINQAWISRKQGEFTVGPYAEGDVYNMENKPTLEFVGVKPFKIRRDGETIEVVAGGVHALNSRDSLVLHNKMAENPISVQWLDIVCLLEDINMISTKDCAEMGIKVTMEYDAGITHHVAEKITGEPNQLPIMLLGSSLVTKKWTQEVIRRLHLPANLPEGQTANLEDDCALPPTGDYIPPFSPNLNRRYRQITLWRSNQDRRGLFEGRHFMFLIEGPMVANAWKDAVTAGGGTYETFDIHQGISKWSAQLTLSRSKAAEQSTILVLIANEGDLDAAVGENWKVFIRETQRIGLRFLPYDRITEATLLSDRELLKSEFDPGHPTTQLASGVAASFPDDPSSIELTQDNAHTRRIRQVPSASPAVESFQSVPEAASSLDFEQVPARSKVGARRDTARSESDIFVKLLRRRVREPSAEPLGPSLVAHDLDSLPPPKERGLLRRRNPTQTSQAGQTTQDESVLDKHRRFFEETDPERQLGSQSQAPGAPGGGLSLMDMVEEADRQRLEALEKVLSTPRKRKASEAVEDDAEPELVHDSRLSDPPSRAGSRRGSAAPPSKKRTLQRSVPVNLKAVPETEEPPATNPTKPKSAQKAPPKVKKAPTQLDKDENFLVALASMKKGKKKEEQTDRDFNKLRIAKPTVDDVDIDMLAWEMLPKDMDIRGNFMICVENVEARQNTNTQAQRRKEGKPEWIGRPDFKKFRKNVPSQRTAVVELVANLSLDAFEEEAIVEEEPDQDFDMPHVENKGKGRARATRTRVIAMSDNEDPQEVEGFSDRAAPPARSGRTRTQQKQPLFMADSDEEAKSEDQGDQEEAPPVKGKGDANAATKRKAVVLAAESSEDEAYDRRRKKRK